MRSTLVTRHSVFFADSGGLSWVPDGGVDLVVTSPPYPMVEMWDSQFAAQDPETARCLECGDGAAAFEAMHRQLERVWRELYRVLRPGGIACLNVGDATRSIGGSFQLFPNHSRVLQACTALGFQCLPQIIWRKQTNAPTKFVGSGTLPAGAYVTLEHEWVLLLRKGGLRRFANEAERRRRRESAFFWEERNLWFSDIWDLKGVRQEMGGRERMDLGEASQLGLWQAAPPGTRPRSGSFPFELAERLVCMFSLYGDVVLDPFLGAGTTLLAAMACGRNSIGVEIEPGMGDEIRRRVGELLPEARERAAERVQRHLAFVASWRERGKEPAYRSRRHGFPVVSRQETEIRLLAPTAVRTVGPWEWEAEYREV
ncbi:MAG: site-specific DNA-methyltransferase [Spirochaetales bacterium]|nr:site-specific DNA-methyltransferase [Spirochaetales bacterium]